MPMGADPSPLGRCAREVLALAWPATLQGLVTTLVFFTDRLMLGRYGAEALASMQISGPVMWSVFTVFGAFSAGTVAVVGRAVGAQRGAVARETLRAVLCFAVVVGLTVSGLGWVFRDMVADLMASGNHSSAGVRSLSVAYMGVVFLAAPMQFLGAAGCAALQASGDTRSPMWIAGGVGLVNLALTWLLMFGKFGAPELGVVGAGIGSAAAMGLYGAATLGVLLRARGTLWLRPTGPPRWRALVPVLRISGPALLEKLIFHAAFLMFAALVGRLGDAAMTINQVLIAIESVGFICANGFGVAAGALVAQRLGAARPRDATRCGWMSAWLGALFLLLPALIFVCFSEACVAIFSDDPVVIRIGAECLRIAALAQPLMALSDALAGALRGAGETRHPMLAALVGPALVRLSGCWLLAFEIGLGLPGIWIATTADWAVRAVYLGLVFHAGGWRHSAPIQFRVSR